MLIYNQFRFNVWILNFEIDNDQTVDLFIFTKSSMLKVIFDSDRTSQDNK